MISLRARAITSIGLLATVLAVFVHTAVAQDNPNAFNRLMKPPSERNAPPESDGIHDPTADGTLMLQPPQESFAGLPKSRSGNYVNWSKAIENELVAPRSDIHNPDAQAIVFDLNIVREVKGSMPDVVYPHKQHTEWLGAKNVACATERSHFRYPNVAVATRNPNPWTSHEQEQINA
jgi:hypothetical protein